MHRTLSGFTSTIDHHALQQDILESSFRHGGGSGGGGGGGVGSECHLIRSLLCNLSILKERVHDIESFLSIFLAQENNNFHPSYNLSVDQSMAFSTISNTINDIVETASDMRLSCQQMIFESNYDHTVDLPHSSMQSLVHDNGLLEFNDGHVINKGTEQGFYDGDNNLYSWYLQNPTNFYNNTNSNNVPETSRSPTTSTTMEASQNYEVVELEAADLLARYTHCCQVCGRGFKREANLKMHMRTHGDHYKTSLISNNTSNKSLIDEENNNSKNMVLRKYSCPQEGCRWNKKHSKFQPLKSIVCVRNHYKRTHCHKMFMCKRCNLKQFSVLSDLKTHEKHCGDVKWHCSCGSSFSKKDKLMDHVGLFVGHTPLIVVSQLEGLNLQFS
ncbi:protein SENSITIVE TO PROTON RHIZOTOXICITY 2-like [Amaranthus tricolor]|uniref:protein SENSITIVE TO PROTON RHIZOTOXICITY 2-like n=1 Tax=Amaranthus tricolor TaxID=29722 RepID=UPI00258C6473|nr:protein SENSITIVE TO PROTON RHIZOTOXICITY 2-like [Amaranthus tricolor]